MVPDDADRRGHGIVAAIGRHFILTVLIVLVAWPPLHMVLSKRIGFSSWRFAGWGMYATPAANTRTVHVLVGDCRTDGAGRGGLVVRLPGERGSDVRPVEDIEGYLVRDGVAQRVPLLARSDEMVAVREAVRSLRTFGRVEDMARLATWSRTALQAGDGAPAAVLVAQPRLDTTRVRLWHELRGWMLDSAGGPSPLALGDAEFPALLARFEGCHEP